VFRCIKFTVVLPGLTVLLTIGWEVIFPGKIYYCTDEMGFGYLMPGWVHGDLETLDQMPSARSMSEPDVIRSGWTPAMLWIIWSTLVVASIGVSVCLSRLRWSRQSSPA